MFPIAIVLLAAAAAVSHPFQITTNKPFVPVTVDGSAPLWFILDSGNNGGSIIARECADRLGLERGDEARAEVGAGAGADVRLATGTRAVTLRTLGETLSVAEPRFLTLAHVSRTEGRRVDGLLGADFLSRHVVEIDYAQSTMTLHDPAGYEPAAGATVVPLELDTGWPIVEGTVTTSGGQSIPCRLIVDTGVRFTIALFRPFAASHRLYDSGSLHRVVIGAGAGGLSRGDVGRLEALSLGSLSFQKPVAMFSRDTSGVFAMDGPDGIVGGELLRRHRVTFVYPHGRMILEPYAAAAGLRVDDEIVSIDGRRTPGLTIDEARALFRAPGHRALEIRRGERLLRVRLETRRMV